VGCILISNASLHADTAHSLEQALRNFSVLTQGDIIEIIYNGIRFEILIMEILPEGAGISVLDTDLEVCHSPPSLYLARADGWQNRLTLRLRKAT
jgi:hypothetical protein